ncbi:MAG: hypothetical protein JRF53_01875 [Deltaproteobacteria bacterium]|nr:hypothetical protein [Deltaproteobacteria bacterium]MBW2342762.1 hypothetical protein [Deltaproteobacteria bacterium]
MTHNAVGPAITFSQEQPEKSGLLKRFLDWLIRGANEANMGGGSCPT